MQIAAKSGTEHESESWHVGLKLRRRLRRIRILEKPEESLKESLKETLKEPEKGFRTHLIRTKGEPDPKATARLNKSD